MVHFGEWKESVHHEFIVRSRKARVDRKKKEKKVSFFVAETKAQPRPTSRAICQKKFYSLNSSPIFLFIVGDEVGVLVEVGLTNLDITYNFSLRFEPRSSHAEPGSHSQFSKWE